MNFKLCLILILTVSSMNSQNSNKYDMPPKLPNQTAFGYDRAGSYQQLVNANTTTIEKGGKIQINHYFSGYGQIDINTIKIFFSTSADIIEEGPESFVLSGYRFDKKTKTLEWGGQKDLLQSSLHLMPNSSVQLFKTINGRTIRKEQTMFDGDPKKEPIIVSEISTGLDTSTAPIKWNIKLKENIKPGQYYITFILTYFNGSSWKNDKVELPIKVMNWHEKYENWVKWSAIIIAFLTFITLLFSIKKDFTSLFEKEENDPVLISISKLNKSIEELNSAHNNLIKQMDSFKKKDSLNVKKKAKKGKN